MSAGEFLKTPLGVTIIGAIIVNFLAVLACGLKWTEDGDVFIQLAFQDHGWQTLVMLFLFASFCVILCLFLFRMCASNEQQSRLTKAGVIFIITFALILVVLACIIEIWYVTTDERQNKVQMYNRIVAVLVFSVVLTLLLILMVVMIGIYYEHFYQISDFPQAFVNANYSDQQPVFHQHVIHKTGHQQVHHGSPSPPHHRVHHQAMGDIVEREIHTVHHTA